MLKSKNISFMRYFWQRFL